MTIVDDPRRAKVNAYLLELRDALRLQAWDVEVGDRGPDDTEAVVAIQANSRLRWAPVFLAESFWDEDPEEARLDLVHEFVHLILWDLWEFVDGGAWLHQLAQPLFFQVKADNRERIEQATHFLARLLAPTLPMPPQSWHPDA